MNPETAFTLLYEIAIRNPEEFRQVIPVLSDDHINDLFTIVNQNPNFNTGYSGGDIRRCLCKKYRFFHSIIVAHVILYMRKCLNRIILEQDG